MGNHEVLPEQVPYDDGILSSYQVALSRLEIATLLVLEESTVL